MFCKNEQIVAHKVHVEAFSSTRLGSGQLGLTCTEPDSFERGGGSLTEPDYSEPGRVRV